MLSEDIEHNNKIHCKLNHKWQTLLKFKRKHRRYDDIKYQCAFNFKTLYILTEIFSKISSHGMSWGTPSIRLHALVSTSSPFHFETLNLDKFAQNHTKLIQMLHLSSNLEQLNLFTTTPSCFPLNNIHENERLHKTFSKDKFIK